MNKRRAGAKPLFIVEVPMSVPYQLRLAASCSRLLVAFAGLLLSGNAAAFGPNPPFPSMVVEFYNTDLGHYFYTLDEPEIAMIDSGVAGRGWLRTGLGFFAWPSVEASGNSSFDPSCNQSNPCVPVSRFYGTRGLGPNSHFFTADPAEAEYLKQPNTGWSYERTAFFLPIPNSTGSCNTGAPVYRFYNHRWMFNDSNHRYVASEDARVRMRNAGWIDEGIAFCAVHRATATVQSYAVEVSGPDGIVGPEICNGPTPVPRSCVAVSNLPLPRKVYAPASLGLDEQQADAFSGKTQIWEMGGADITQNVALPATTREAAARDVFVQLSSWQYVFGINLSTLSKGPSSYSSISPMVRIPGTTATLRPRYETSYEISLWFDASVSKITMEAGSQAYGVATVEYQDSRSGRRVRANVLAYGTVRGNDFVARDRDGVVMVGTSFREGSRFGRAWNGRVMTPPFDNPGGGYLWLVNRQELAATVAAARSLDPLLSDNPDDYFIRSFGLQNEIYGRGEMSLYLTGPRLEIRPVYEP